ncbi:MAG: pyridoxal-dependent decarboxylase [Planctomycetaceae bacterium]|nr:pyridoxal-dependent decarboxylase [Planctomycetaceae bacterium]
MSEADDPERVLRHAALLAARAMGGVRDRAVEGRLGGGNLARRVEALFSGGVERPAAEVLDEVAALLGAGCVQTTHPAYFGPFHPGVLPEAAAAALLVAAFNPQLATRDHAKAAQALESMALAWVARAVGWEGSAGHFTNGGQEANTEALAAALAHRFPRMRDEGLRALERPPMFYLSAEAHHSFDKAAQLLGLGRGGARRVPVGAELAMDVAALEHAIAEDRNAGREPFLLVATAGTTASGAIDPLGELASMAAREGLWLHTDAAWGGLALFSPKHRQLLEGIERSDSVTIDAHKALAVPLGAGMLLTRHGDALAGAFGTQSPYMPGLHSDGPEPYQSSLPWSRRAIGLPLAVALAVRGAIGYTKFVDHLMHLGAALRERLLAAGFTLHNHTLLPLVCFDDPLRAERGLSPAQWARRTNARGRVWLAPTRLANGVTTLRATIANHGTQVDDIDLLVTELLLQLRM